MNIGRLHLSLVSAGRLSWHDARRPARARPTVTRRAARSTVEEQARCPACGTTLPVAILMPRHCPRCVTNRNVLVELERFPVEASAGAGVRT